MAPLLLFTSIIAILFADIVASQDPPQNRTACSLYNTVLHCKLATWKEDLLDSLFLDKNALTSIRFDILKDRFRLTKKHLMNLNSLLFLNIRGLCVTKRKKKILYCIKPAGITGIDDDAFEATPSLIGLTLKLHSINSLTFLRRLKKLRFLKLIWFRSLMKFDPSVMDGFRSTIERLMFRFVGFSFLKSNFSTNMKALRDLEVKTSAWLWIESGAISNLPSLQTLELALYYRKATIIFDDNSLSNLPNLVQVGLKTIKKVNFTGSQPCSGVFNIRTLNLVSTNVSIFDRCPQLLYCEKCGRSPSIYRQSVILRRPYPKYGEQKWTLLPTAETVPVFNITDLYIYHSEHPYPFEMLSQLPLLKVFAVEDYLKLPRTGRLNRVMRFRDNPFTSLPASVRLEQLSVTLTHCDCQLLEIIKWMKTNRRYDENKTADDIFKIDCFQVDGVCSDIEDYKRRQFVQWMDLTLIEKKLTSVCYSKTGTESLNVSQVSTSNCRCQNMETCKSDKVLQGWPVLIILLCASFFAVELFQ